MFNQLFSYIFLKVINSHLAVKQKAFDILTQNIVLLEGFFHLRDEFFLFGHVIFLNIISIASIDIIRVSNDFSQKEVKPQMVVGDAYINDGKPNYLSKIYPKSQTQHTHHHYHFHIHLTTILITTTLYPKTLNYIIHHPSTQTQLQHHYFFKFSWSMILILSWILIPIQI